MTATNETARRLRLISFLAVGEHRFIPTSEVEVKSLPEHASVAELQRWHESAQQSLRAGAARYFIPTRKFKFWRLSWRTIGVKRIM